MKSVGSQLSEMKLEFCIYTIRQLIFLIFEYSIIFAIRSARPLENDTYGSLPVAYIID